MTKIELLQLFNGTIKLPTPSQVALEIMRLCYSDDSSLQDIAAVVEIDPSLSAELIKFANSALMPSPMPVASVQRAAVKIGMKGIVNLALGFSMLSQYQTGSCKNFNYSRFWVRSLAQAAAARSLATANNGIDNDESFTCCLLSHIGELGFATAYPQKYSELISLTTSEQELLQVEHDNFGLNHHDFTAALMLDWGIPEQLSNAAGAHGRLSQNQELDEETLRIAKLYNLAGQIADTYMVEFPLMYSLSDIENFAEEFNIPTDSFSTFFDQFVTDLQVWGNLLDIPTRHCPGYLQIKELEATAQESAPDESERNKIVILAVDDDPLTLLNLDQMLSSSDRKVITADNGEDALKIAVEEKPDILITDWHMPGQVNGLELCRQLRRITVTQHMYIIILTGIEEEDELVTAFDYGADDYVVKPFTPKVLEARLRGGERMIRYQRTITSDRQVIQKYASKLAVVNHKLQNMAMTDTLTNLPNRRSAMARLKDVVAESTRYNEELSCILIDIDHFKEINDTYGHDNGDIVLQEIGQLFEQKARSYDMVSRIGGEEFLVISTRSNRQDCLQLAERLRAAVAQHDIQMSSGETVRVTISLGVASWNSDYEDGSHLIKTADKALYLAKHNGRNRVETA